MVTWLAAAAHEVTQELGDFAIMVRGGWPPARALLANFLSAAAIVPGGLVAYWWSAPADIAFMLAFAAGTFIYIAASDLIPEESPRMGLRPRYRPGSISSWTSGQPVERRVSTPFFSVRSG
jgi:zinc and cadmium transporter